MNKICMESGMKVIFWGAGRRAIDFLNKKKNDDVCWDAYVAIVDNNRECWGQYLNGLKIIAPYELQRQDFDFIVITTRIYETFIRRQLLLELNVAEEQIITLEEYERICFVKRAYRNRYGNSENRKSTGRFDTGKIVVYTAIMGEYDSLKEPLFQSEGIDYICFTNNLELKSNIWDIHQIENHNIDDVHLARYIKLNPHTFFPEYETSVWVDGKFLIMSDIRTYIAKYQRNALMICFPHYERMCIGDEAAMCTILHKGNKQEMFFQITDYWKAGYPMDYGLYDTGCLVRAHNDPTVKMLMEVWEKEINKYSIRDQLSFPYVCWKNNFVPDICDLYIGRNPWLKVYPHNTEG